MPQLEELDADASSVVDLSQIDEGERVVRWQAAARSHFPGLSVRLAENDVLGGIIRRMQLGAGELFHIESAPACVSYQPPADRAASPVRLTLMAQISGTTVATQSDHACVLRTGELCVLDEARPFNLASDHCTSLLVFRLPRAAVISRYPQVESFYARALSPDDPGTGVLSATLLRLRTDAEPLNELQRSAMMNAIIQMVGVAGPLSSRPADTDWRVRRALEYIEVNLSTSGLTADAVANDQHISRRRLDQLMQQALGKSIAHNLWSRRLEKAAADLRDPRRNGQSIAQIAFANGFEDAAHFARAFKRRFCVTPGQWRLN